MDLQSANNAIKDLYVQLVLFYQHLVQKAFIALKMQVSQCFVLSELMVILSDFI